MDNQTSALQQQYPLSKKKFWKKIIPKLIVVPIPSIFFALFFGVAFASLNKDFSVFVFLGSFVIVTILFCLFLIAPYAWYVRVYIRRYYYDGNNDFLTIKKGVFTPTEIHVQYQKIQDVYVDQDLLDRLLGIYDVHIASATVTSGIEAHIDGVDAPVAEGLKNFLLNKIKGGGIVNNSSAVVPSTSKPTIQAHLSEDISNSTYPIHHRWIMQKILGSIISLPFVAFSVFLVFSYRGKKSDGPNLMQLFGWNIVDVFVAGIVIALLYSIGSLALKLIWARNFRFQFLPEYIYIKEEVIAMQERHVPYNTIQDVIIKQGIIERFFGLATVYIQNAAVIQVKGKAITTAAVTIPGQLLEKASQLVTVVRSIALSKDASTTGL